MGIQDRDYYRDEFNKMVNQHDNSHRRSSYNTNGRPPQKNIPWGVIIVCVIAVVIFFSFNNHRSSGHNPGVHRDITDISNKVPTSKIPELIPPSEPLLQEKEPPKNGAYKIYYPAETYVAPLTVEADPNNHYIVKLVDASRQPVLYVFVRANSTVNTKAPLGTFEIQWVCGEKWYGDEHLFGSSSTYRKSMQNFVFQEESTEKGTRKVGHTIRFNTMTSGNMPSEKISANEF